MELTAPYKQVIHMIDRDIDVSHFGFIVRTETESQRRITHATSVGVSN